MRKLFPAFVLTAALATPIAAQAPSFQGGAPVAYMIDLSSGAELFVRDADRRMPPASMSKMMTAYVAFDLIKKGELKLDQRLRVRPETWTRWNGPSAGSTMFLSPNQEVTVADLLDGIVVVSGNDASVVLAEGVAGTEEAFAGLMNAKAKELGMTNSNFCNSNGWPDAGCTYVTARDLAKLAAATVTNFPDLYKRFYPKREFTFGETMGGSPITQPNRDPLLGRVNGADGLKTGHTDEAGYGFTGSAERDGRRLVMVVAGLDSYGGRAEESVRFMEWGFGAWRARPLVSQGKRVTTAEVQSGSDAEVGLVAPKNLTVTIPAGASPDMEAKVVYTGPVKAPIAAGQHIADLVVSLPGMAPQTMPLVAETAIDEAGFFGRAWAGLMALFA